MHRCDVATGPDRTVAPAVAAGIRWAVDHGARACSSSAWQINGYDFSELGAVEYAQRAGCSSSAPQARGSDTNRSTPADIRVCWRSPAPIRMTLFTAGRPAGSGSLSLPRAAMRCSTLPQDRLTTPCELVVRAAGRLHRPTAHHRSTRASPQPGLGRVRVTAHPVQRDRRRGRSMRGLRRTYLRPRPGSPVPAASVPAPPPGGIS